MKKPFVITFVILGILIIAGFGFYIIGKRARTSVPTTNTANGSPFGVTPADLSSGKAAPSGTTENNASTPTLATSGSTTVPNLFKISDAPVAGGLIFLENKKEVIRYVDRATGHIYDVDPLTLVKTEIVNNTQPKVYQAIWKPDGSTVIFRTLPNDGDTIMNTSLALSPPVATASTSNLYSVKATELRGSLEPIVGNSSLIAYVEKDAGTIATSDYAGAKAKNLFTSAFNEWQLAWSGANLVLTADASAQVPGYAYLLSSGSLVKLLGPLNGLTSLSSPDGSRLIYSYVGDNGSTLFEGENIKGRATTDLVPTTLPEKCAWSGIGKNIIYCGAPTSAISTGEPDNWYQGATHFSDDIWKYNTDTGLTNLLAEPKKTFNIDLDVINPELSPNEDYLLFMNKTDLSLWALKLSQ